MSGGVDSSVAAAILKNQGHEAAGIFLHFWKEDLKGDNQKIENKCCSTEALMDARRVCQKLGIRLYTFNFSEVFKERIVDNFLAEYAKGNTPNPCVRCNKFVKLGLLIEKARKLGFDYVASGHYAKIIKNKNYLSLAKAKDRKKDQSYFLYKLGQDQLKSLIFPLGDFLKSETREIAKKLDLPTAKKSESQEICFIPGKSHNEFLARHLKLKPGKICAPDGKQVGEHKGLALYTLGQRKGIEIGGIGPFYALSQDFKNNILYVTNNRDDASFFQDSFLIKEANWIKPNLKFPLSCQAVIRYGGELADCKITKNTDNNQYLVKLAKPLRAITSGQSAVFYFNEECLGGGVIC